MRYGISMTNDPDRYDDIIDLSHHQSSTRLRMRMADRAAQFASFKAMAGYEDMIKEESRLTEKTPVLSEEEKDSLDRKMKHIADALDHHEHPEITLTVFIPDAYKKGGRFEKTTGKVKKLDLFNQMIVFYPENDHSTERILNMKQIVNISG